MPTKSASKTITRESSWLGPAIHPGEMLLEEYLKPLGVGQVDAARRLGISLNRLNEIVLGKRGITADTALRLGRFLKTSPQLWMRLQADWDLDRYLAFQLGVACPVHFAHAARTEQRDQVIPAQRRPDHRRGNQISHHVRR